MMNDVHSSLATMTQDQYKKKWQKFKHFSVKTLHKYPFKATREDVSMYVTHLHNQQNKATTIRTHLSAIAYKFKLKNKQSPTESFRTNKLLVAYTKTDKPTTIRKPIKRSLLKKIVKSIQIILDNEYEKILFTSLFTLMYHALLRIGEVSKSKNTKHILRRSQVYPMVTKPKNPAHLIIQFKTYKHSKPTTKPMSVTPRQGLCPVKSFKDYLTARPKQPEFVFVHRDRSPLTSKYVREVLNKSIQYLGLDCRDYNTHSLRIGRATDMCQAGYTDRQIALAGRWNSSAFTNYIKPNMIRLD